MTAATFFTLFDTALGPCALAWVEAGLVGVWLPEADTAALAARIRRQHPQAVETSPEGWVSEAVGGVRALLSGERRDLDEIPLALETVPAFEARVYRALRMVLPGQVVTYGELAQRIGEPGAAQAVGRALGRNPWPVVAPCHRVVAADGRLHGFSAPGGLATKRRLLEIERARQGEEPDLFDAL